MTKDEKNSTKGRERINSPVTEVKTDALTPTPTKQAPIKNESIKVAVHAVKQFVGKPPDPELYEEEHAEQWANKYGIKIDDNSSGRLTELVLTDFEFRIMEGILRGFTQTEYEGNRPAKDKNQLIRDKYKHGSPDIYKYVKQIPTLFVSLRKLIELSGGDVNSQAHFERTKEAIKTLGTKQFYFMFNRLSPPIDNKGKKKKGAKPEMNVAGSVDTLFTIIEIEGKGYEIMPSPIFLDQINTYFLLVPYNWREEIKKQLGGKKGSSYLYRFLYFLRLEYEQKRRKNSKEFEIKLSWETIAKNIRMPQTLWHRNKKTARGILKDCYDTALKLGYLKSYKTSEEAGYYDILELNPDKYYTPQTSRLRQGGQND